MQVLWPETNQTLFSEVFSVPPGQVCLLFATNLQRYRHRVDATTPATAQRVCVRKMLHSFNADAGDTSLPCGFVFDTRSVKADVLADTLVYSSKGTWSLSSCHNVGIIGLPGSYRLELNDATAIGVAQVYAELHDADKIPLHVKDLFFS